ncbi:2-hydroxy-6-oxonona-2,4-dienedioate hydrolase/4,5:9,10-diseco-3-hydroxy-5,9,17-trioxoandrosta-1(10),2-diene-4-oate hydrolase [Promicromonospora sp. AC04]|uniref:alpha/beta fold hydrolase n=1 Tax=Promicromonospora sp. AC04 TaxID=2135723 RepID=UPI000D40D0DB|nr:alpha/beta fold hydrolase [Promicromonospora sp. AC04]PUB27602.1 2-hydroxy-6-oxonona-2,4-dienedioate hydrolase/4,5:9,10-diseco-3-hydroxy-5,9,17-trioxoandrosta-1(10),2-diene-4-oate hydrolase [Promicromonospora sp. AC04]
MMVTTTSSRSEHAVRVGRREIFVTEAGSGPAVVLLHGGGAGASGVSNYDRNIDALAQHFRVIVPDMPGYGRSTKGIDPTDPFGDLALFVRGLLDTLDIDRAHLVGNSYGGAAALRCALDRPERVDRLVLMGPGGVGTTRSAPTKGLTALLDYYRGAGPSLEKLERFIREYLVYDGAAVPQELIERRYAASIDPEVIADPPLRRPSGRGALRTLLRMDFTRDRRLRRLAAPTLVLWGADDKVNRPEGGHALLNAIPRCDLYVAARTGHWVQWERAELFNSLTIDFLTRGDS